MTVDPNDAAASLRDIAATERRTREAITYAVSSWCLMLWGGLTAFGYLFTEFFPRDARVMWLAILAVGLAANFLIVYARSRARRPAARDWRLMYAMLVLVGYGFVCHALLGPLPGRETAAFWPSLFMFGFVVAGLWLGRLFLVCGLVGTALIIVGYFALGAWFYLWMAAVQGATLILGGLWLRRIGAAP